MGLISNGTTIFDAGSMTSGLGGALTLIKRSVASSAGSLAFMNGSNNVVFDSTYKEYIITITNWNPATDDKNGEFSFSTNGSNFGIAKTSTYFRATHNEGDTDAGIEYRSAQDLAQSTGNQILCEQMGSGSDENSCAILHIYNPGSTTFVKHFMGVASTMTHNNQCLQDRVAGYINTTSAVVGIKFECESGASFDGIFTLYGVS